MMENRQGQVVTFYSYKGGTGRTMALANVAWILAANGKRVLVADWDVESPGLHRFFSPFIDPHMLASTEGVINLLNEFAAATTEPGNRPEGWLKEYARLSRFTFSLLWDFPGEGTIDFLGAGRQNRDYTTLLMDWDVFHGRLGGGQLLDALREEMKQNYDYTLIDSRTGLSDVADVCTIHLPDVLVDCFTYSNQGIIGASDVAKVVKRKYRTRNIRVLPVPMRVDMSEKQKAAASRTVAMHHFAGFPTGMSDQERNQYWATMAVPYQSFYSYEETLATLSDQPGSPLSHLLFAYEMLTGHITNGTVSSLPPMDEAVRARASARFQRKAAPHEEIMLHYDVVDQVWAEWIDDLLRSAKIQVIDPRRGATPPDSGAETGRVLRIVSANTDLSEAPPEDSVLPLVVYVANVVSPPGLSSAPSEYVYGLPAEVAADRILKLVGATGREAEIDRSRFSPRFPGQEPAVANLPARNARFTGREEDILNLRSQLRTGGSTKVTVLSATPDALPVTLQGMGGIGKTQLATEYAHRYRCAYDIVWWVNSDPSTFVDVAIADLGTRLKVPTQPTTKETAAATKQTLERGEPFGRWLLIFDNAEDIKKVSEFIPAGGHVLITSRDSSWGDHTKPIELHVFQRSESTTHLVQRLPEIRPDQANRIADLLGDLPIAVAAAGAWLADTGADIEAYIQQLNDAGPNDASINQTFKNALEGLQRRSKGAFRLLQLCSVLSPDIELDLVYSDEMASALASSDSTVSDQLVTASLVQHLNRLSLLRLDKLRRQVQVHRVLQHVVKSQMSAEELVEARHQVHRMLAASRPRVDGDDPRTWPRFRILWPHLEVSEAVSCPDESVRRLLIDRVRYLWLRGDLVEGRRVAELIDPIWTEMLASTPDKAAADAIHRQLLHMRFNFANILRDQAQFKESYRLNEQVLAAQMSLLPENHPHTLMTANGLAADLRALGRYPDALEHDRKTYRLWAENFGEDHPRTLIALNNLAASYRHMGDFRSAREHDEAVFSRREAELGEDNPSTLMSASNLGRDIREAGDYAASVEHLSKVVAQLSDRWGDQFRLTLNVQVNLAASMRSAGLAEQAAPLLDNAFDRLTSTLGPAAPDTLACRLSRAVNLLALGEITEATEELQTVRIAYERALGPDHPHTLLCVNNLAAAARAGQPPDTQLARGLALHASENLSKMLGPKHPYTLAAIVNFAVCTAEDGDLQAAQRPLIDASAQLAEFLGRDHPDAVRCEANLALVRVQLGQQEAESAVQHTLTRLRDRLGASHPAVEALTSRRLLHRIVEPHPF